MSDDRAPERFYERFAGDFDARMNAYEVDKRLRLVFSEALAGHDLAGQRFLDAGCGTGRFSAVAAVRGARVTSLDVGEALLAEVAKKCDSDRIVGDLLALPFEDASFDVVLSTEAIEHTADPARGVRELTRVVRPGGTLVLTTPNRIWHPAIVVANRLGLRPYEGLENWSSASELERWFAGFGRVRLRGFNAIPFVHRATYGLNDALDRFGDGPAGRLMINLMVVATRSV